MSRYYTMAVTITGAAPERVDAVKKAAESIHSRPTRIP